MARAYVGLGSNLGNREANLRMAVAALTRLSRVIAVSALYETDPVGKPQPTFFNAACSLDTGLDPLPLLRFLQAIEAEVGRRPAADPGGPRPADLDLLLYEGEIVDGDQLTLPHPRLAERAFVLVPLAEIAGQAVHPLLNKTIAELAGSVPAEGLSLVRSQGWDGVAGADPQPVKI